MRFNLMPCLLTYSRLIKSYATFTGWSCDLFYVRFDEKIRLKKKISASRENNLTIGGGKTMGVEPYLCVKWMYTASTRGIFRSANARDDY